MWMLCLVLVVVIVANKRVREGYLAVGELVGFLLL